MTQSVAKSRIRLVLVFSLFLGPLIVAFLWYYGMGAMFMPTTTVNHAKLISPVITLDTVNDEILGGDRFTEASFKRKWTIVHIAGSTCDETCQTALYNTRQTRLAVGKDANRVQRVVVLAAGENAETIKANHPDIILISNTASALLNQIQSILNQHQRGANDAVIIDPLGNAMMVIPVDLNPSLLLKDLKKLLKLSRIG